VGTFLQFSVSGGFGIFLWFFWNFTIFHDPLYFIYGPYSASAQQSVLAQVGQLPTKGNILISTLYYGWSMIDNNGLVIMILSGLSLLGILLTKSSRKYIYLIPILLAPVIFNILALFVGQSAMNIPQAPTGAGYFNTRYGLIVLPSLAILVGILASHRFWKYICMLAVVLQVVLFVRQGYPITLIDGQNGLKNTYYTVEASAWFRDHYEGGLILTSLASHDAFVARAGLPMRNYVHEGTREYWDEALINPSDDIQYITVLSFPPDSVYRALAKNKTFLTQYTLVHNYEKFEIYKRK
jgi:hypothetical protein